jgi:hypothetical protein
VKSYSLASASNEDRVEMWHGIGVVSNGFALRFNVTASGGGSTVGANVRLFDNAGNAVSGNIAVATLTGIPATGQGGRGDSLGFHGNGKDAYVQVNRQDGSNEPYITVLNANGTLRWARRVGDAGDVINATRVDGAIAEDGRAIAVWGSQLTHVASGLPKNYVQARLFNASGQAFGRPFLVSEWERPDNAATLNNSVIPRVAWRGSALAITWQSENAPSVLADPFGPYPVLAARLFAVPPPAGLAASLSGGNLSVVWSGGTLESADAITGPWSPVIGASSPYTIAVSAAAQKYFRLVW